MIHTTLKKIEKALSIDANYFFSGGFWLTAAQVFISGLGLVLTIIFSNILSQNELGIYRYLIGLAAILSSLSLTGFGQAILQASAKGIEGFYRASLKTNFKYSLLISFFSIGLAAYYYLMANTYLAIGCLLIAFIQPLINTFQFVPNYLNGQKRFKESSLFNVAKAFAVSLALLFTIAVTKNILVLFFVFLTTNALANFLIHYFSSIPKTEVDLKQSRSYFSYAKHTSVRNIVSLTSNRLDSILLFTQIGAIELAIYYIATVVPDQIKSTIKNLATLITPKYALQDYHSLRKSVKARSLHLFLVLLLITAIYLIISPFVYNLFFPKYEDAVTYTQLAALSIPSLVLLLPYSALQVELSNESLYKLIFSSSIFQILFLVFAIFNFGILGAIVARIIYRYLFAAITYYLFFKVTPHAR